MKGLKAYPVLLENGHSSAAGCGFARACDVRYDFTTAFFALGPLHFGIPPPITKIGAADAPDH